MKVFTRHQLILIQETIVDVMWTKKEVIGFLEDCNVQRSILKAIELTGLDIVTKRQILENVFSTLTAQPNKGTPEFTTMVDQLTNWRSFNSRWFEKEQTLDQTRAESAIDSLRMSVGKAKVFAAASNSSENPTTQTLSSRPDVIKLKQQYLELSNSATDGISPQARGFAFEIFLAALFTEFGIATVGSFRVNGMRIDGSFKYENHHYLLEAKWRHSSESAESIFVFAQKISSNMDGRGLFISINGFTQPSILALTKSGVRNVILMDGLDLFAVLDDRMSLNECLDEKIRAAQTRGDIFYDPVQAKSKMSISIRN